MLGVDAQDLHSWIKENLTLEEYARLYLLMTEQIAKMKATAERLEAKERAEK